MKNIIIALTATVALTTATISCNKSSLLGAELFSGDQLPVSFTDALAINAITETNDSVFASLPYDYLPLGKVNDPMFGKYESKIYTQFDSSAFYDFPNKIDSVVLVMGYSPKATYGDTMESQKISVYRLTQEITNEGYFSNKTFLTESTPIGSLEFTPRPSTFRTITLDSISNLASDTLPQIRIRLSDNFKAQINDTIKYTKNFNQNFKGIEIRSEKETGCMMNFDFGTNKISGIYVYYHNLGADKDRKIYVFRPSARRFANFKNDYANAPIKPFLNNQTKGDSLVFIQGMSGVNAKIEFPSLDTLGKISINKAELEFTVKQDPNFPPINQIILRSGKQEIIQDATVDAQLSNVSLSNRNFSFPFSGGQPKTEVINGETVVKYHFALSTHLQRMLYGLEGNIIYLTPFYKSEKGSRVVLFGSKTKFRPKLNLTYTKVAK